MRPVLELLGIALIVAGCAVWSTAAALIVAGGLAIVVANKASYTPRPRTGSDEDR